MGEKLSGAQRRKLARQKAVTEAAVTGVMVAPPRELPPLRVVRDYRHEINRVYRDLHFDRIRREDATSRVFILNTGAALAKAEQELGEMAQLREQLEEIKTGRSLALVDAERLEVLPVELAVEETSQTVEANSLIPGGEV